MFLNIYATYSMRKAAVMTALPSPSSSSPSTSFWSRTIAWLWRNGFTLLGPVSAAGTNLTHAHSFQDEIALGIIIGALIGWGFRHLLKFCEGRDLIDRKSYVAQYIALALLSNGITALLGSDDLLAAFTAGAAFAWDSHFNQQTADSVFSSVIDLLFNVAVFVYIGAWMPFDGFNSEVTGVTVWRLVVLAILVLLLRRLPIMIILYKWIPDVRTFREALFSGHFGPSTFPLQIWEYDLTPV
jgi:NhaP-type Na+/H+ or K+/H+ antiporter